MQREQGIFIVIEGTDGSGKGTQFEILAKRLRSEGYDIATFDFPRYDEPSSYFVKEYLNGNYGTAEEVGPYTGSLFYALDRFAASFEIKKALQEGKIVLANRYVGSNMAHQGTKFVHAEERRGYFIWLDNLEFEMLRIPRPTLSFVLRVPAETAQALVDQKEKRSYTDKKRDLHEADLTHLQRAVAVYDDMCQLFPRDFLRIDCTYQGNLLPIPSVHDMIWQKVEPMLPPKPAKNGAKKTVAAAANSTKETVVAKQEKPLVRKRENGAYEITKEGKSFLQEVVTSSTDTIYAFTNKLGSAEIATLMASLQTRAADLRSVLLDQSGNDASSQLDADWIQRLAGQHVVVEGVSSLITQKLERGRQASYLEQSLRHIAYEEKDADGNYHYVTPDYFKPEIAERYRTIMDQIFGLYAEMVQAYAGSAQVDMPTAREALQAALPVAAKTTVGVFASGQALEGLITRLLSDPVPEARKTGQAILDQARKVVPNLLEGADQPDRGGAVMAYRANTSNTMRKLAEKYLPTQHTDASTPVQLTDVWPRNELDIIPDMLFEHSNLPLAELREAVANWPYNRKLEVFDAYIGERLNRRHRPGRALEKIHYSWDLMCDYGIFRDLQRHRIVNDVEWQELTPRYGYEVPKHVEEAGLADQFETCFDLSLKLYSILQDAGYLAEAQYATLLGHRMRWRVTYNAREAFRIHEQRTSSQGYPGYRKLVSQMRDKLCEVHPMLGEAMKFASQDEDPAMTRQAAERYTQFKQQKLDAEAPTTAIKSTDYLE